MRVLMLLGVLLLAGACEPMTPVSDPGYACAVGVRSILGSSGGSAAEADRMFDRCLRAATARVQRGKCECPAQSSGATADEPWQTAEQP